MTQRTVNQAKGRLGELEVVLELERQGISCVDMTSQDYGLDAVITLPELPLPVGLVEAIAGRRAPRAGRIAKSSAPSRSWEMSASMVSVQIKKTGRRTLGRAHLQMWAAANERRPGSCFVVFVEAKGLRILDPIMIRERFERASEAGQKSIGAFSRESHRIEFGFLDPSGRLGRYFTCWAHHGVALSELTVYRLALASGGKIPLDEADWVVESAVLLNHLEDDLLQQSADSDGEAVTREVRRVVEIVAPTCDDRSFADGDRVDELARRIISDNTWADAGGREKAFSRHNRALPNLMPGELEAFVETYARHYLP